MDDEKQTSRPRKRRDDGVPTQKRQAELRKAYEHNMAADGPPYADVKIHTRGEVHWVFQEHGWVGTASELDQLRGSAANLSGADLSGVDLSDVNLDGANLSGTNFRGADLSQAGFLFADLGDACLSGANLSNANLKYTDLSRTGLSYTILQGADLKGAKLAGADLREAHLDADTRFTDATLDSHTRLVDVEWNGAPVTRLNWEDLAMLGDETEARDPRGKRPQLDPGWSHESRAARAIARRRRTLRCIMKAIARRFKMSDENLSWMLKATTRRIRLSAYEDAVLANRQVATVLRSQGLNEDADRFAYRAQLCQRIVLLYSFQYLHYAGSLLLGLLAGYGYRPLRTLFWYLAVITSFAFAYFQATHGMLTFGLPHSQVQPLAWYEALVLSVSSFHGRGFFQPIQSLGDPVAILAAIEAVFGLFIEISFIATFTQRYFGK